MNLFYIGLIIRCLLKMMFVKKYYPCGKFEKYEV